MRKYVIIKRAKTNINNEIILGLQHILRLYIILEYYILYLLGQIAHISLSGLNPPSPYNILLK